MRNMKRLLFVIFMIFCPTSFSTELICSGMEDWMIINAVGYKGKTSGQREITVAISLIKTDSTVFVRKVFSGSLPFLSGCFFEDKSGLNKERCKCSVREDEISCSYVEQKEITDNNISTITINRKTALAEVFQQMNFGSQGTDGSYTLRDSAKLQCQVFEKNQF
jgi:hypothetical protein